MTMLPNSSIMLIKLGTILMISRHLIYSLQNSPMHFIKRSTSLTTCRITYNGSIMPWSNNASGFMSKPASTSSGLPPNLVQIGGLVLLPQLDDFRVVTLMPWIPHLGKSVLDLTPLMPTNLCAVLHFVFSLSLRMCHLHLHVAA